MDEIIKIKTVATTSEEGKPVVETEVEIENENKPGGQGGKGGKGGEGGEGGKAGKGGKGGEGGEGGGGGAGGQGDGNNKDGKQIKDLREAIDRGIEEAKEKRLNTHLTILKVEEKIRDMVVYKFHEAGDEKLLEALLAFFERTNGSRI